MSRRSVLKGIAIGATSPVWLRFAEPAFAAPNAAPNATRHLLVVFLRGGNDPLQTVAPMGHVALQQLRPSGLRDGEMFALGNGYGISRHLPSFFDAWKRGELAVVQQGADRCQLLAWHRGAKVGVGQSRGPLCQWVARPLPRRDAVGGHGARCG
ncbi:MAG: hypothetical protein Q8K63_00940, partial [Acidimicrobiales bacterium]|nr:hypothetical protein [Acidimicrobiales bacterium]